jgi:hypothetical protein
MGKNDNNMVEISINTFWKHRYGKLHHYGCELKGNQFLIKKYLNWEKTIGQGCTVLKLTQII